MKCQNCPADVKKLTEVEVANASCFSNFWLCDDCLREELEKPIIGYIKKTGQVRTEI